MEEHNEWLDRLAALTDAPATAGGGESARDVDVDNFGAVPAHNRNARPKALQALVVKIRQARTGTRNLTRDYLRIAAGEARLGYYPFTTAVSQIKAAAKDSYAARGEPQSFDQSDFRRLVSNAVRCAMNRSLEDIQAEANRTYGSRHDSQINTGDMAAVVRHLHAITSESERHKPDHRVSQRIRFPGVTAAALAEPIPPMSWLIRNVWPQRSAGVLAGEKKTFKTWNLQAMAIAVAAGLPYLDEFVVPTTGPVLYLCGEGGRDGFANRHQVIGARYRIRNDDLASLPFMAEFDTDELTSPELLDGLARHLDELQPALVIVDPLYAYHPSTVEASNLYARGPMLARLREIVEGYAALVIGDHFKKSATGFDLDNISMAGVGQWADSWGLQRHRQVPDLAGNVYRLEAEFCTRRGGGSRWEIDWALERDPHPDHVAWQSCDWAVRSASTGLKHGQDNVEARVMAVITDRPFQLTRRELIGVVGIRKDAVLSAVRRLIQSGDLVEQDPARGRAKVLGPAKPTPSASGHTA